MATPPQATSAAQRRSTRIQAEIPVRVRSLDPNFAFEETCKTLLVNAQGCGFHAPRRIPPGIAIVLSIEDRQATATVLNATKLPDPGEHWVIGAKLHQSGNFWGLPSPPADWVPFMRAPAAGAVSDEMISQKVAAEIQRQSEQMMSRLRAQIEGIMEERQAQLIVYVTRQVATRVSEQARQSAEQEVARVREMLNGVVEEFRRDISREATAQAARAAETLRQVQEEVAGSAAHEFAETRDQALERMRGDVERLSTAAISHWQQAFEHTLRMIPDLVREQLRRAQSDAPPGDA